MPATKADYGKVERGLWEDEIRVLRQLTRELMLLSHERHQAPPSLDITEGDLAAMVRSGVIRPVETKPRITLKVFKIPKKGKEETRLLIDGRPFDNRTSQPLSPITPSLRDVETFVLDHMCLAIYDDIAYGGPTKSDVLEDEQRLRAALAETNIQIREDKTQGPAQVGAFNGLVLDLAEKTLAIPREWVDVCLAHEAQRVTSFRALAQRIGCLRWALYVMRCPAAAYPGLLRASRLVSGRCVTYRDWDTLVVLPQELLAELKAGKCYVSPRTPRDGYTSGQTHPTKVVGWSSWIRSNGPSSRAKAGDGRTDWRDWLRRREFVTAILGVLLARHVTTGWVTLDVFHDNSTAESRHRKLASPYPETKIYPAENRLIVEMQERLYDVDVATHLVPSENMVADFDTRD
ncbi:hypothetical protein DIPPA_32520 [Diplonema papillatum]|nr:hypothetical protein DIPPA_32520 [Diplonema papillatum]